LAVAVRYDDTGVSPEVVLVDLSTNQFFYDQNIWQAYNHAYNLAYFGSEEAILAGTHLRWFEYCQTSYHYYSPYDDGDYSNYYETDEVWIELKTPDEMFHYATLYDIFTLRTQTARKQQEEQAIYNQLNAFNEALEYLNNTAGLVFYVGVEMSTFIQNDGTLSIVIIEAPVASTEELYNRSQLGDDTVRRGEIQFPWYSEHQSLIEYSNVSDTMRTVDFFKSQPVYYIALDDHSLESHIGRGWHSPYDKEPPFGDRVFYLAFSDYIISAQNVFYSATRDAYITDLSIIAASVVLALGLIVVLLISAGRKNKVVAGESGDMVTPTNKIHFTALDKPYWDFGLLLLFLWIVLIVYVSVLTADTVWSHRNITAMNILIAAVTLLAVPPVLLWLTSLAKRIKAGQFWKHTLVYAIITKCIFRFLRYCIRTAKSLWSGMLLSLKIAAISFVSFCMMFFVGVIGSETRGAGPIFIVSFLLVVVVTVLLLLYASRIRRLSLGARTASEGDYNTPIDAGGGELGSIANSINNITAGIHTAVEERLKSERLKTELITNVSHDIRTPLTSIITYTDLLDREGLDCDKAPEYLDVLKQKSQRLKTLTDELFEAAKAATGNIDVNLTDLNIGSLINQALGELDSTIKTSGLDIRVNLAENLYARADGRLMQRVMENLLSNVVNYSLPGSRVYLDAYLAEDSYARIDIKNISATELNFDPAELTERFKRGDNSRTDGGSGLGLSIVQSFMVAQNGRFDISIDGDLFKATITLHIPHTQL